MNILDRVEATAAKIGATITNKPASKRATITREEAARREAARRAATGPTGAERDAALLRGIRVYQNRFARAGDPTTAAKLTGLGDTAEAALNEYLKNTEAAGKHIPDTVGEAAQRAAKGMMRAAPGAFTSEVECAGWCIAHLPLTEARLAYEKEQRDRQRAGKAAAAARKRFLEAVEGAAIVTGGDMWNVSRHVAALLQVGLD